MRAGPFLAVLLTALGGASCNGARATPPAKPNRADLPTISVLFIGNSYTYVNDLPTRLHELGAALGAPVDVQSIVAGGATLRNHLDNPAVLRSIREGHFNFVVLQGQSAEPLTHPREFSDAVQTFVTAVRAAGSSPVLYETWARRAGNEDYRSIWSHGNPAAMQAALRSTCHDAAARAGAMVAPVGDALEQAERQSPGLTYYAADGSHPSPLTTFLAAAVFFEVLRGRPAIGAPPAPGVTAEQATFLEGVAHASLYDATP